MIMARIDACRFGRHAAGCGDDDVILTAANARPTCVRAAFVSTSY